MTEAAFQSTRPSVHVDGEERPDVQDALTEMVVNLPLNGMSHAELTISNWGQAEGARTPDFLFQTVGLGKRVEIYMGSPPVKVFDGEITALEERYGDGAPRIALLAQDKLHRLARNRRSRVFDEQAVDDIVQTIAGDGGFRSDVNVSAVASTYHQINESDLAFLLRLLGRFDIALRLDGETLRARAEDSDAEPFALDAQDSILGARLIVDLNHQPSAARVLGFNAATDESVDGSAERLATPPSGTTAADVLRQLSWPGEEVLPQPFARTQGEADSFAQGHFNRQAKRFVSGDIRCQGEPSLKSGREIALGGVSDRLRGIYQVVHCVHRFGSAGYETHLKVNRPDWSAA